MRQALLARFFPPSKTAKLRDQITWFNQKDGESLYDAWEHFKEMLRFCPHHGLEKWLLVHTFYNGLSYTTKMTIDAAAGGALINKTYTEAYALIEDMAQITTNGPMKGPTLLLHPLKKRQVCTKSLTLIILLLRLTH